MNLDTGYGCVEVASSAEESASSFPSSPSSPLTPAEDTDDDPDFIVEYGDKLNESTTDGEDSSIPGMQKSTYLCNNSIVVVFLCPCGRLGCKIAAK